MRSTSPLATILLDTTRQRGTQVTIRTVIAEQATVVRTVLVPARQAIERLHTMQPDTPHVGTVGAEVAITIRPAAILLDITHAITIPNARSASF
jgi:hypothetical protein